MLVTNVTISSKNTDRGSRRSSRPDQKRFEDVSGQNKQIASALKDKELERPLRMDVRAGTWSGVMGLEQGAEVPSLGWEGH